MVIFEKFKKAIERENHNFEKRKWYLVVENIDTKDREFYGPFEIIYDEESGPNVLLKRLGFDLDLESDGTLWTKRSQEGRVIWARFKKGEDIRAGRFVEKPTRAELILPSKDFSKSKFLS